MSSISHEKKECTNVKAPPDPMAAERCSRKHRERALTVAVGRAKLEGRWMLAFVDSAGAQLIQGGMFMPLSTGSMCVSIA